VLAGKGSLVGRVRWRAAIDTINGDSWREPTDWTRWDIRDVVVHVVASAQALPIEFFRQLWQGRKLTAEIGGVHWVDGLNEVMLTAPLAEDDRVILG
jgi:hypothetical protein